MKFEKVSYKQFYDDYHDLQSESFLRSVYDGIKLPKRATKGSAGYDFFAPEAFTLQPGETIKIPTGIRAAMDHGWVLQIYPRSGLGFKYQESLCNTVGIIDEDYYYSDNEGHIQIKIVNRGDKPFTVAEGQGFAQGIFMQYGMVENDMTTDTRNGGFGSTTK